MHYLIPVDFSDNSLQALDLALALATPRVDRITVLHVIETHYDFASQVALRNYSKSMRILRYP